MTFFGGRSPLRVSFHSAGTTDPPKSGDPTAGPTSSFVSTSGSNGVSCVSSSGSDGAFCVASSGSDDASCVSSSGSDSASCVFCSRSCYAGCCFSSSSCTSSCGAHVLTTYSPSPGFTPGSSSPTPSLPVLLGLLIHCTACRFTSGYKHALEGYHWPVVAVFIASVVFAANASAAF